MPSMIAASSRPATSRSSLLGAAAAAAGAGEAAMGVFMAGQQIATGKYLSYTRGEEEAADAAGAKFLSGAGISGRGSVEFFHKLLNQETRAGFRASDEVAFWSTHPLTNDRIQFLQDTYEKTRLEPGPTIPRWRNASSGCRPSFMAIWPNRRTPIASTRPITTACPRIMPAPMPITRMAFWTKPQPKPTRCWPAPPTIPIFWN
jgi:hypothetical protein